MDAYLDFSISIRKALAQKGIRIIGSGYAPINGSYLNCVTVYHLDDNGTWRGATYLEVEALAQD